MFRHPPWATGVPTAGSAGGPARARRRHAACGARPGHRHGLPHFTLLPSVTVTEDRVMSCDHVPAVVNRRREREALRAVMRTVPFEPPLGRTDISAGRRREREVEVRDPQAAASQALLHRAGRADCRGHTPRRRRGARHAWRHGLAPASLGAAADAQAQRRGGLRRSRDRAAAGQAGREGRTSPPSPRSTCASSPRATPARPCCW